MTHQVERGYKVFFMVDASPNNPTVIIPAGCKMAAKTPWNQYSHHNFGSFGGRFTIVGFFVVTTTRSDIKDVYFKLFYI